MPKFNTEVQLTGKDGNAFSIMASVRSALKKAGATEEELAEYFAESTAGDYHNLLRVADKWVIVK